MRRFAITLGSFVVVSSLVALGCGSGGGTGGAGGTGTSGSTTSSTKSSTGSTTSTGTGTTTSTTTSTGTTTSSTTSSTGSSSSSSASTGTGMMQSFEHLVINEISTSPAEFFEIWNPTPNAVDLSTYYVSDNSQYYTITDSTPMWSPITANAGTDFVGGFPAGAMIAPGAVIVVATKASGFEPAYNKCPDYVVATKPLACGGKMVPALVPPKGNTVLDTSGLSNAREMLMLFTWDGTTGHLVKDIDYALWGTTGGTMNDDAGSRADKTMQQTYLPDTFHTNQKFAEAPAKNHSIVRTGATETSEKMTGGNGATGHDETSEDMSMSFTDSATPTPGVK